MNTINLLLVASAALSLGFSYIPGLKDWYDNQEPTHKRLVMAGVLALTTLGVYGYGCAGRIPEFVCDSNTAWNLATAFVLAIMANQSAYELLGKFGKVTEIRIPVKMQGTDMTSLTAVYGESAEEVTAVNEVETKDFVSNEEQPVV